MNVIIHPVEILTINTLVHRKVILSWKIIFIMLEESLRKEGDVYKP